MINCYCCSGKSFANCCLPYLALTKEAESCEVLMRSRYSAYCVADTDYLLATLLPSQHTAGLANEITLFAKQAHFCRLDVEWSSQTLLQGQVKFKAYFLHEQKLDAIVETSDFIYDKRWYYKSGKLEQANPLKIGRNDLCPCGSSKKFKQCSTHLPSGQTTETLQQSL